MKMAIFFMSVHKVFPLPGITFSSQFGTSFSWIVFLTGDCFFTVPVLSWVANDKAWSIQYQYDFDQSDGGIVQPLPRLFVPYLFKWPWVRGCVCIIWKNPLSTSLNKLRAQSFWTTHFYFRTKNFYFRTANFKLLLEKQAFEANF